MAYMSQEKKREIHKNLKPVLKKWGLSGTLGVEHHSGLRLKIRHGKIDFIGLLNEERYGGTRGIGSPVVRETPTHLDVNPYHYRDHFVGEARQALIEIFAVLNDGNWDKSDIMTDYFNVGWYVYVNVGRWDRPYEVR